MATTLSYVLTLARLRREYQAGRYEPNVGEAWFLRLLAATRGGYYEFDAPSLTDPDALPVRLTPLPTFSATPVTPAPGPPSLMTRFWSPRQPRPQ